MDLYGFKEQFSLNGNKEIASQMEAYMRNQFSYLGIPSKQRKDLSKAFIKNFKLKAKMNNKVDWRVIDQLWSWEYREFQYVAIDCLVASKAFLKAEDLVHFQEAITSKSWWDSVDGMVKTVGHLVLTETSLEENLLEWSEADNIWLRRTAILHQLGRKEVTNTTLLAKILDKNLNDTEFFINKAIGWALRDYSKLNPRWVAAYLDSRKENLSNLSIKEASKYI